MMDFRSTNYADARHEQQNDWRPGAPQPRKRLSPLIIAAIIVAVPLAYIGWQLYRANNPVPHEKSLSQVTYELRRAQGLD